MTMTIQPLPKFEPIELDHIPSASALLFYGGNKITEWYANHRYKHPYKPGAFHAAIYLEHGLTLNVGAYKVIHELSKEFLTTRRVDVIVYKDLTDTQRSFVRRQAYLDADDPKLFKFPTYGVFDFLRFEPLVRKFVPASKRKDICSENVAKHFSGTGCAVSEYEPARTAPWHLLEYALAHPGRCDVRTVWVGEKFNV